MSDTNQIPLPTQTIESSSAATAPTPRAAPTDLIATIDEDRDTGLERLKDLVGEASVIRLVDALITRAVEMRASDIHIEAADNRLRP